MADMSLSSGERKFWKKEFSMLDELYRVRMDQWQRLFDVYNKSWKKKVRDLEMNEVVWVPLFYSLVQQTIATIAYNHATIFFTVEDEDDNQFAETGAGNPAGDILERAASSFLELSHSKLHVHQAIFDSRFCGLGWLRLDYNPPGDDLIPPYTANDAMAEDMVAVSRMPPGFVHLDPQCPPHILGHARYIREKMWVPLKQLRDDKSIKNRRQINRTDVRGDDDLSFGEPMREEASNPEQKAIRESVTNGDFVLVDRVHDRMNRKMIMFAPGVDEEIQVREHPFAKVSFPQVMTSDGQPSHDPQTGEPVLDMDNGTPAPGWLVPQGFPFIPVKFDMSQSSFYPVPPMEQVFDLQMSIIESMSRMSGALKRGAEQYLVRRSEADQNEGLVDGLRKGVDGQYHLSENPENTVFPIRTGAVPPLQQNFEDRALFYLQLTTRVNELGQAGEDPDTATEAGLLAAASSILREWMESGAHGGVAGIYTTMTRGAFGIMGDPRYTPERFVLNVAPSGQQRLSRALRHTDFLWTYRMKVEAGSTRPLFEELQRSKAVDFFDRASQREGFDQTELDKFLASAYEVVDPEKLLRDEANEDALQAVALENEMMVQTGRDPGVSPGLDHMAHIQGHQRYVENERYQELAQLAQATDLQGNLINPQAVQMVEMVDETVQNHIAQHQQALEQLQQGATTPSPSGRAAVLDLQGAVQSTAQTISNTVQAGALDVGE